MKDSEEKLRREAIRLYLQEASVSSISKSLKRSRQWVYKWLGRFRNGHCDWYKEESKAPKNKQSRLPDGIEQSIILIRERLSQMPYSQQGAISIMYELKQLGVEPPSVSSINRILKKHGSIHQSTVKVSKSTEYPTHYLDVQQMDLIGPRYLQGGFKFYIFTIIDKNNHTAGVYPIATKSAKNITCCVVDFWQNTYRMPDYLQMDNELSFRGSNRHPRGLGLLLRTAISNGGTPIFIPSAEPWRNGIIEKFNHSVAKHFLPSIYESLEEMQLKAKDFTAFHNSKHRYSSQNNKTPDELTKEIKFWSKLTSAVDLDRKPGIEEGQLIFIRFIRSDLKLHLLNSTFTVSENLVYTYVEAVVQIEKHCLAVLHKGKVYHYFEFVMPVS